MSSIPPPDFEPSTIQEASKLAAAKIQSLTDPSPSEIARVIEDCIRASREFCIDDKDEEEHKEGHHKE